jgi:hypothetical protein
VRETSTNAAKACGTLGASAGMKGGGKEEMTMAMTRAEHIKWCKERAHREYDYYKVNEPQNAIRNATASMLSDLGKHPETANMQEMAFLLSTMAGDEASLFKFIDGFAE